MTKSGSRKLHICPKVTKVRSIIGHRELTIMGEALWEALGPYPAKINPSPAPPPPGTYTAVHLGTCWYLRLLCQIQIDEIASLFFLYLGAVCAVKIPRREMQWSEFGLWERHLFSLRSLNLKARILTKFKAYTLRDLETRYVKKAGDDPLLFWRNV